VIAVSRAGRRAARLILLGLPGTVVVLVLVATVTVVAVSRPAAPARGGDWVTSWGASPQAAAPGTLAAGGFHDQTIREIVYTSAGGNLIRVRLTNAFGTSPLRIGHVTVAQAALGAAVVPGTIHPVLFGGRASVRIPPGAQVLSDPVAMQVGPEQDLAVSVYLPGRTGRATLHWDAYQVNWVSAAGDHAAEAGSGAFVTPVAQWYYLSGLVVQSSGADGTVVALGDSITDGVGSTVGGNARWPNDLAQRLDARPGPTLSMANEGIGGNRVLAGSRVFGVSAEDRFARDALDQPGVRDIILLEGINDIGFSASLANPDGVIIAARIIAGYERLIAEAHARHIRIFGATLLPFQGAGYYTPEGEAAREAVNTWIRASGAFDGVIDFDRVMRDPADPRRLNPVYDCGDHLHPDDAGYLAMANAVNLDMLLSPPR
jgi:lysophospholipase L1-like esterase